MDKVLFKRIQNYRSTPLLDKVESHKELPENIEDWFVFDCNLNRIFVRNEAEKFKGIGSI